MQPAFLEARITRDVEFFGVSPHREEIRLFRILGGRVSREVLQTRVSASSC